MGRFSRRKILGGLGLTAVAAGGASYLGCAVVDPGQTALAHTKRLDVLLTDLLDAARIGHAARSDFGIEALRHAARQSSAIKGALDIPCKVSRQDYLR